MGEGRTLRLEQMVKVEVAPLLTKRKALILKECYRNQRTIPLLFSFAPFFYPSVQERLSDCTVTQSRIDSRDLFLLDGYFLPREEKELLRFSQESSFSAQIFARQVSLEQGQKGARSMNSKERWATFSTPPSALKELFKFFSFLADRLQCEVSLLPWELYDGAICTPAFATNFIDEQSHASSMLDRHRDYAPKEGIAFEVARLYQVDGAPSIHPPSFSNGERGAPYLITFMLYLLSEEFVSERDGLGTLFYGDDGTLALTAHAQRMRLVVFDGEIIHAIEESKQKKDHPPWRISYVFKLLLNPRKRESLLKEELRACFKSEESCYE